MPEKIKSIKNNNLGFILAEWALIEKAIVTFSDTFYGIGRSYLGAYRLSGVLPGNQSINTGPVLRVLGLAFMV